MDCQIRYQPITVTNFKIGIQVVKHCASQILTSKMKKSILIFAVSIGISFLSQAQEKNLNKRITGGFQLSHYQKDFGIGLNLTSPRFIHEVLAVRLKGNLMWNEHLDNNIESTWSEYSNVSLGITALAGKVGENVKVYGEGGVIYIMPSSNFSTESYDLGGYGLFGFEFYFHPNFSYYIELGGMGTGAKADKVPGEPIYSNGFTTSVGFRFIL